MKKLCALLLIFNLLPFLAASGADNSADLDSWKDQILYFVLLDRFANGDQSNDRDTDQNDLESFHGGDIAGLITKLDYLDKLGVTGVWLSPFFSNRPDRFFKQGAYHGYWPHDFWSVDQRFGSEAELVALRGELTRRHKKLLLDMVVNHMGYDAPFIKANPDWFNPSEEIKNWNDKNELLNRCIFGLPDFASQKSVVKTFFRLVARHWIDRLRPDGFRLDAVKHVPADFWRDFNANATRLGGKDFLLLGEYLNGDPAEVNQIWNDGGFNSLFDFPLYYTMKSVFAEGGDCRQLASRLYFDRNYPDAGLLATFLDNHDLDRFITSCGGDRQKYALALAFLLTSRGIPVLCYGDENGLEGAHGKLPENRRSMQFDTGSDLFDLTRQLIALRRSSEALRRGLQCHVFADSTACVYGRLTPDSLALVAINNDAQPRQIECALPFNIFGNRKILDASLGSNRAILRDGRFETYLPARSFAVYLPQSEPGFYEKTFRHWQKRFHHEKSWGSKNIVLKLKVDYLPEKAKVFVTGNADELGAWNQAKSLPMLPVADDEYEVCVSMPLGKIFECKCFYTVTDEAGKTSTVWMEGDNTIGEVKEAGSEYLHLSWKTMK
ncbi:MAG TPA: alpha-amylase family glycosyl hydrolase [Candidatus Rifleibacterium sp.]|nr:alpha-amylase family glycosyl hydrolase [Candidatus Rifleibacterium sp.]